MNENNDYNKINENSIRDIKTHVLERIHSGDIQMKPKFHHLLKVVSLMVVALLTLLISSFLVSFIVFSVIESGKLFLLGFGMRGFLIFFVLFPWSLLAIEIGLIVLLEWLIKKFKFGYRSSLLTLILVILCISIAISVIINVTPFHKSLLHQAERRDLPVVGGFYRDLRHPGLDQQIFRGLIASTSENSFSLIEDGDADNIPNEFYTVFLPENMSSEGMFNAGDTVFVAGQPLGNKQIRAFGIEKFSVPDAY